MKVCNMINPCPDCGILWDLFLYSQRYPCSLKRSICTHKIAHKRIKWMKLAKNLQKNIYWKSLKHAWNTKSDNKYLQWCNFYINIKYLCTKFLLFTHWWMCVIYFVQSFYWKSTENEIIYRIIDNSGLIPKINVFYVRLLRFYTYHVKICNNFHENLFCFIDKLWVEQVNFKTSILVYFPVYLLCSHHFCIKKPRLKLTI